MVIPRNRAGSAGTSFIGIPPRERKASDHICDGAGAPGVPDGKMSSRRCVRWRHGLEAKENAGSCYGCGRIPPSHSLDAIMTPLPPGAQGMNDKGRPGLGKEVHQLAISTCSAAPPVRGHDSGQSTTLSAIPARSASSLKWVKAGGGSWDAGGEHGVCEGDERGRGLWCQLRARGVTRQLHRPVLVHHCHTRGATRGLRGWGTVEGAGDGGEPKAGRGISGNSDWFPAEFRLMGSQRRAPHVAPK